MTAAAAPLLHERFPALATTLPHRRLGTAPTPVRETSVAEVPLWVKDEGAYGDGPWGGNKVRKLEWLLPDALRRGRRTVLTVGGLGTNWGLAAASYGRQVGLDTVLALVDQPVDDHVRAQLERLRSSGATLHFTHTKARTVAAVPALLLRHGSGGRPPYLLPAGGSSALGAVGYVEVAFELEAQVRAGDLPEPGCVVVPVGSGGTAAGLALGLSLTGLRTKVVAVVVNDQLRLDGAGLERLARRSERLLRRRAADLPAVEPRQRLQVERAWLGPGYGHATPEGRAALAAAAETGLPLDPVYTAKAMAALLDLHRGRRLPKGPVLFCRTDGPR